MNSNLKKDLLETGSKTQSDVLNPIGVVFNLVLKTIFSPPLIYAGWHLSNEKDVLLSNLGWGIILYSLISLGWAYLTSLEIASLVTIPTCILMGILLLWLGGDNVFWGGIFT